MSESKEHALPRALSEELAALPKMAIAFSGGLDSRFLCHAARLSGREPLLVHATGPHVAPQDTEFAQKWARAHGYRLKLFFYDPLELTEVRLNTRERCYACKKALFAAMAGVVEASGGAALCDGSHAGDTREYRPGARATLEAGIISPLAAAGMDKDDIRAAARITGMDYWDQTARPCLLTRFAYGLEPNRAIMARIADCEAELGELAKELEEAPQFRLRITPAPLLQWSVAAGSWREVMSEILSKHGFANAQIMENSNPGGFFDREFSNSKNREQTYESRA